MIEMFETTSHDFEFTFTKAPPGLSKITTSDDEDSHSTSDPADKSSDHAEAPDESDADGVQTREHSPPSTEYGSDRYSPPPSPTRQALLFASPPGAVSDNVENPKRLYSEQVSNTPNTSPQKKKMHIQVPSSIQLALDVHGDPGSGEPKGLT
jgi:hypothetical protein